MHATIGDLKQKEFIDTNDDFHFYAKAASSLSINASLQFNNIIYI